MHKAPSKREFIIRLSANPVKREASEGESHCEVLARSGGWLCQSYV